MPVVAPERKPEAKQRFIYIPEKDVKVFLSEGDDPSAAAEYLRANADKIATKRTNLQGKPWSNDDETAFTDWYSKQRGTEQGKYLPEDPDDRDFGYDFRKAYAAGSTGSLPQDFQYDDAPRRFRYESGKWMDTKRNAEASDKDLADLNPAQYAQLQKDYEEQAGIGQQALDALKGGPVAGTARVASAAAYAGKGIASATPEGAQDPRTIMTNFALAGKKPETANFQPFADALEAKRQELLQAAQAQDAKTGQGIVPRTIYGVGQSATMAVEGAALGAFLPPPLAAAVQYGTMGGTVFNESIEDYRAKYGDTPMAYGYAAAQAALETGLELASGKLGGKAGANKMMREIVKGQPIKATKSEILRSGAAEVGTEIATSLGQMGTEEKAGLADYSTVDYVVKGVFDTALQTLGVAGMTQAANRVGYKLTGNTQEDIDAVSGLMTTKAMNDIKQRKAAVIAGKPVANLDTSQVSEVTWEDVQAAFAEAQGQADTRAEEAKKNGIVVTPELASQFLAEQLTGTPTFQSVQGAPEQPQYGPTGELPQVQPPQVAEQAATLSPLPQETTSAPTPMEIAPETQTPLVAQETQATTAEQKKPWEMTYPELRKAVSPYTKEELVLSRPILSELYPEEIGSASDPWGIDRAVRRGDEIPRVPVADLSVRHRRSITKALSEGRPVPPEVLAEYPDLAEKYGTQPQPEGGVASESQVPKERQGQTGLQVEPVPTQETAGEGAVPPPAIDPQQATQEPDPEVAAEFAGLVQPSLEELSQGYQIDKGAEREARAPELDLIVQSIRDASPEENIQRFALGKPMAEALTNELKSMAPEEANEVFVGIATRAIEAGMTGQGEIALAHYRGKWTPALVTRSIKNLTGDESKDLTGGEPFSLVRFNKGDYGVISIRDGQVWGQGKTAATARKQAKERLALVPNITEAIDENVRATGRSASRRASAFASGSEEAATRGWMEDEYDRAKSTLERMLGRRMGGYTLQLRERIDPDEPGVREAIGLHNLPTKDVLVGGVVDHANGTITIAPVKSTTPVHEAIHIMMEAHRTLRQSGAPGIFSDKQERALTRRFGPLWSGAWSQDNTQRSREEQVADYAEKIARSIDRIQGKENAGVLRGALERVRLFLQRVFGPRYHAVLQAAVKGKLAERVPDDVARQATDLRAALMPVPSTYLSTDSDAVRAAIGRDRVLTATQNYLLDNGKLPEMADIKGELHKAGLVYNDILKGWESTVVARKRMESALKSGRAAMKTERKAVMEWAREHNPGESKELAKLYEQIASAPSMENAADLKQRLASGMTRISEQYARWKAREYSTMKSADVKQSRLAKVGMSRELTDWARTHLKGKDRVQFMRGLAQVMRKQRLGKAYADDLSEMSTLIRSLREQRDTAEARTKFSDLVKTVYEKRAQRKGGLSTEARELLSEVGADMTLAQAQRLARAWERQIDGNAPQNETILASIDALINSTVSPLQKLVDTGDRELVAARRIIKNILAVNKDKFVRLRNGRKVTQEAAIETLSQEVDAYNKKLRKPKTIQGNDPVAVSDRVNIWNRNLLDASALTQFLFGKNSLGDELLNLAPWRAMNRVLEYNLKAHKVLVDRFMDEYGLKELKAMLEGDRTNMEQFVFEMSNGQTMNLTRSDILEVMLNWDDQQTRKQMLENGAQFRWADTYTYQPTVEDYEAIIAKGWELGLDKLKRPIQEFVNDYVNADSMFNRMNAAWEDEFGNPLAEQREPGDYYWMREAGATEAQPREDEDLGATMQRLVQRSVSSFSQFQSRTEHKRPVLFGDPFSKLKKHIATTEIFINMRREIAMANAVLNSQTFKGAVRQAHHSEEAFTKKLRDGIRTAAGLELDNVSDDFDRVAYFVNNVAPAVFLSFKPHILMMQKISLIKAIGFSEDVPFWRVMWALKRHIGYKRFEAMKKEISERSAPLRMRFESKHFGYGNAAATMNTEEFFGTDKVGRSQTRRVLEKGLDWFHNADSNTIVTFYEAALNHALSQGMSTEDAKTKAIDLTERWTRDTQASFLPMDISQMQRNAHRSPWKKMVYGMFISEPIKNYSLLMKAVDEYRHGGSTGKFAKHLAVQFAMTAMVTTLQQAMFGATRDSDGEIDWAKMLRQWGLRFFGNQVGWWPILADILSTLASTMVLGGRGELRPSVFQSTVNMAIGSYNKILKSKDGVQFVEGLIEAAAYLTAFGSGGKVPVPASFISNQVFPAIEWLADYEPER